ncbi:MAG: transglycosylase SLT domain-containing protein [Bacteroidales bacterium]|nr:transglycosylase SLT domain-containing protein [Bacteroidales bacterium]
MKRLATYLIFLFACVTLASAQGKNPQIPEYIYQSRMAKLDNQSPIKLEYNPQVRAYIDVYLERRRDHLANIIGRSQLYFPIFEEYLSKYNLPQELKYLAIIESALDPKAKSKSGAMGLWQFLYHAGLMLDLHVTSYEDERCDPLKSTDAACRYLSYLFQNLGDWQLALAAYNGGLGTVQKAIERAGGKKSFWELSQYMTDEMKAYVPAFIAVNYVMSYYDLHNVVPNKNEFTFNDIDTVYVNMNLSFDQISRATGVERQKLQQLNPQYIKDFIPFDDTPMILTLPKNAVSRYIKNEPRLKPDIAPDMTGYFGIRHLEAITSLHVVEPGEYLHKIAMKYNTTAEKIMEWNNMTSKDIKIGQKLTIYEYREISPYFFVVREFLNENN